MINNKIRELIVNPPWWILDLCPNVNEVFKVFFFLTNFILDKTVPVKSVLVKSQHPKWLSADFKLILHSRDRAERQFHVSRTPQSWEYYRVKRKQVNHEKRKLKAAAMKHSANQSDRTVNRLKVEWKLFIEGIGRGKQHTDISSLKVGTSVISDKMEMANEFCRQFNDCVLPSARPISFKITRPVFGHDYNDTLNFIELSVNNVKESLSKVNQHKPAGLDEIPALFYRMFYLNLASIVTYLFNVSLFMGQFPAILKESFVLPLYKGKGQRSDPSSYNNTISVVKTVGEISPR